jgi:hypothetical protein
MQLTALFVIIGVGLSASIDMENDTSADLAHFSTINRTLSVSQDLSVSDDRKRLEARLEKAPPEDIPLRDELARRYNELPPFYLFDLAERTFSADIRQALEWYWLGHIRSGLDAALCADKTAVNAVASLPTRARTVAKYIRVNPNVAGEVGEGVLKRADLRDSQASPWWICSRGVESGHPVTGGQSPSWLAAEGEMAARYAELMVELAETFQQLKQPMEDHIAALKPAIIPTVAVAQRNISNVLWSSTKGLVLTENMGRNPSRLIIWDDIGLQYLANDIGGPSICVAGDFVSYRTIALTGNGPRSRRDRAGPKSLNFKEGILGEELRQHSYRIEDEGVPAGLSVGGFQRARVADVEYAGWNQSSLTCQWTLSSKVEGVSYDFSSTVALGSGRGFLESTTEGTFHYASAAAPPTKLSDKQYPLKCMKLVPFLGAVNMIACPVAYSTPEGEEINRALSSVSLLKLEGQVPEIEERPLPLMHDERDITQTLVTKSGVVRLMKSRYTPVRKRPGGLYWFGWRPDQEPKKIWEGYPDKADVSDDGCKIAFSTIKSAASIGRERNVLVINVCTDQLS